MTQLQILRVMQLLCVAIVFAIPQIVFAGDSSLPQLIVSRAKRDSINLKAEVPSPAYPRSGRISVDMAVFESVKRQLELRNGQFPRIEIRPFDDISIIVDVRETEVDQKDPNFRSFMGWVVSPGVVKQDTGHTGTFTLGVRNGIVQGSINIGNISYRFLHVVPDGQIISVFDSTKMHGGTPLIPKSKEKQSSLQLQVVPETPARSTLAAISPVTIDVLVAYTAAARNGAGNEATIRRDINTAIGAVNHAYIESDVNQRLRLAYANETVYTESGDLGLLSDLTALANPMTAGFKDVRRWRDQFAADLVSLWIGSPSATACGRGFQPITLADLNDTNGFTVMPQGLCTGGGSQALAHELGHNMGLGHDLAAIDPPPATMLYPYGHGFVGLNATPPFRTIMAYPTLCEQNSVTCPLELFFSNPAITRSGIAAGIAATANESLALNNVASAIAGYRSAAPIKDIRTGTIGSNPSQFASANGTVYFVADDGINGAELWKSDGTKDSTVMLKDIRPGAIGSDPIELFNHNGTIFFNANDGTTGRELWKSDGTAAGTVLVKDLRIGGGASSPAKFVVVNGVLYFATSATNFGFSIWKSDGTAAGTVLVRESPYVFNEFNPQNMVAANGFLFFTSSKDLSQPDNELWVSDGTSAGTLVVKDINPGNNGSDPSNLTSVGNALFFAADDGVHGRELWKSSGTDATTVLIKDIQSGIGNSAPNNLTAVNGALFFVADDGANGIELWKSDGTPGGTVLVKDIRPGSVGSAPSNLVNVNGILYFVANDGVSGAELWKSDGTTVGTILVKDIAPGSGSSSPRSLVVHSTGLYFLADDGANGLRLWKTDGTASGTITVNVPGMTSSIATANNLFVVGDQLFFTAADAANGRELYAISLPAKNVLPVEFTFAPRTEVAVSSAQTSDPITVSGIESPVPLSVEGGAFSIGCTASYFIFPTTINNGQTVCLRHTASSLPNGRTNTTLTIGGISAPFTTTTLGPKTLTVSKGGTGTGTVTSSPAGITCGGTCGADFASATVVTLTTNPDFGSAFAGWQGTCTGTGACSITMDAAKSVTATFNTSNTTVPNAPTSPSAAPGNASAPLSFTAFSDSNAPITSFSVLDSMGTVVASGSSSPILVTGLANDVSFTFTITATNALGTSAPSAMVVVTPTASAPLTLVSVKSRKTHGAAGVFDMPVNTSATLSGAISVEPRVGPTHSLVFQFNNVPASVSSASSTDAALAPVGSATPSIIGNEIVVALVGIPDNQRVRVAIIGVNGTTTYQAPIGFLISDVNNSRYTNGSDAASIKSHSGQVANSSNFLFDINLSGVVSAADVSGTKTRQGRTLP